jgi:hypothetical protein
MHERMPSNATPCVRSRARAPCDPPRFEIRGEEEAVFSESRADAIICRSTRAVIMPEISSSDDQGWATVLPQAACGVRILAGFEYLASRIKELESRQSRTSRNERSYRGVWSGRRAAQGRCTSRGAGRSDVYDSLPLRRGATRLVEAEYHAEFAVPSDDRTGGRATLILAIKLRHSEWTQASSMPAV